MDTIIFSIGSFNVTGALALVGAATLIGALLVAVLVALHRQSQQRRLDTEAGELRAREAERHLADLMRVQSEMTGRMQSMAEIFGSRTSDLARLVDDRLDTHGRRLGQAMQDTEARTSEHLGKLNERLAVIDRAQTNITQLSSEVVSLQQILANKQTRGAFGQGRMEAIVADGLPLGAYQFQATLGNGRRPDALVMMPNGAPALAIDAKFPLESWQRVGSAASPEESRLAASQFRTDMGVHIRAIAENYLISGETADTALMFVPSESIFADLHEHFDDVVQKALRARVVIVSPSILMLSIQVVQALMRDVRMREEAHRIQREVREMLSDLGRLDERVRKLQSHFQQASGDLGDILVSTGKLARRGERIEAMEFEDKDAARIPTDAPRTLFG